MQGRQKRGTLLAVHEVEVHVAHQPEPVEVLPTTTSPHHMSKENLQLVREKAVREVWHLVSEMEVLVLQLRPCTTGPR